MNARRLRPGLSILGALLCSVASFAAAAAPAGAAKTHRPALRLVAVSPKGSAPGDAAIQLRFSAPLAKASSRSLPRLSPGTAGTWSAASPTTLRFSPRVGYLPGTRVHITVPRTLAAASGARLPRPATATVRIGAGSGTRLVQLLAQLRYLPLHFQASGPQPKAGDAAGQLRAAFAPPAGRLRFGAGWPAPLHATWAHDASTVVRGAVMAFESQHGLVMDGTAGTAVWKALLAARAHRQLNRFGYSYAVATESSPESVTVYHNAHVVVRTPANTGTGGTGTAPGTFPVYERLRSQIMRGTNPDGSHYADPVQWVAYFNGGDAIHYMPRASYGSPQSLGCIELPYAAAERAWGYLTYGALVTVLP